MSYTVNPDLAKERHNKLDLQALTKYLGELQYTKPGEYEYNLKIRDDLVREIKPLSEENYYNLTRDQKHQMVLKKSLEICEYGRRNNIDLRTLLQFAAGAVLGSDKFTFTLHTSAFEITCELWGTERQKAYWASLHREKGIFGTYVQTELGHGTYVRGIETTATYDKTSKEFILDSPTLTSTKFWPGGAAKTSNFATVMAQLVIDGVDYGIHGFVVQLRSMEDHRLMPGIEAGDIGMKAGFDSTDNGYIRFNKVKIPLFNMLAKHAVVMPDGKFERIGNEMLMYASMMLLRVILVRAAALLNSASTAIAIRYSCVRRQTAGTDGKEPQIIEYKTQQYRLFPALAHCYAYRFTANRFINSTISIMEKTNDFANIDPMELNKIHALTAGLKAGSYDNARQFSQSNRLCCGGHGYSLASGIPQIVQELDAGSTYEGDNVVLLLQTARYLLKCAQTNQSPHLDIDQLKSTDLYKQFAEYFSIHYRLFDEMMMEITSRMMNSITEKGLTKFQAWNESSVLLITAAKVYINIYVMNCFLDAINGHSVKVNQQALSELFELFLLYNFCDAYASHILRFNIIESSKMSEYNERLGELLSKIRENAVLLVDAFDFLDSNLCSALGAYDGRAYERLLEFAKQSQMNGQEVHEGYAKYQKPYAERLRRETSKL